jgi:hypothetical protein
MKSVLAAVLFVLGVSGALAQDACLEAVGGLSAGHTYTSYLLIGTTADGFAQKAFDADHVAEVATEIGTLCGNVTGLLAKLRGGKLSDSDSKYLGEIEAIYALLKEQSSALAAYAKSNKNEDMEKYEKARTTVYPKIQTLLGIGDKDAPASPAK